MAPSQIVRSPVIVQTGAPVTTTVALHVLLQPLASVMVTEYSPAAETVMQAVVAPVLHK